jgi:hypothetical protein
MSVLIPFGVAQIFPKKNFNMAFEGNAAVLIWSVQIFVSIMPGTNYMNYREFGK